MACGDAAETVTKQRKDLIRTEKIDYAAGCAVLAVQFLTPIEF